MNLLRTMFSTVARQVFAVPWTGFDQEALMLIRITF